jgi:hypothetical protein
MSDGYIQVADQIYVGFYQADPSFFNMTGGEANIYELHIGNTWGDTPIGVGHVKLHGGTMYAENLCIGGEGNCSLDITDGVFIADADLTVPNGYLFNPGVDDHGDVGDYTGTVPILISKGIITAYDANHGEIITDDVNYPAQAGSRALVKVDYDVTNPGKTTLSAMTCDPNLAWNEKPSSGSSRQPQLMTLSWSPGLNAASHDVYFGTSFTDVDNGTGDTFIDNRDTNSYSPDGALVLDTTYYWRIDEVNDTTTWKGLVWNFRIAPGTAANPSPADGAWDVSLAPLLSWAPGIEAVSHELYFSTDFNDVNERLITPVPLGPNSYNPGSLQFDTTYYWAVDEVNGAADVTTWYGDLWQFTTASHLIVDSFNSYANDNDLWAVWDDYMDNDSASEIYFETEIAYDGNSMKFIYDNAYRLSGNKYGSWSNASIANLQIGPDWTLGDAKALWLVFYGDPDNSTTVNDKMYIALDDGDTNGVAYYPDVNDINEDSWHEWHIDLEYFNSAGVNLANVSTITIGFGTYRGSATSGGDGTVYFDRIELWPPYCRSEFFPADIDGDCIADIADLQIMSADWLIQDYNFIAEVPDEANLIGWWKLDEGVNNVAYDSSIYGNDGNAIETIWVEGYTGEPGDYALKFDGDAVVDFDHVICAEREGNTPGTYPAELMPDTFTVSCWTKLDSFAYFSSFVGNGIDTGNDECGFFFYNYGWNDDNGRDFGLAIRTEAGMNYVETENIYDTGTWYHLATIYDGNYASVYVDGLLAAGPTDVGGPIRWISEDSGNYPESFIIGAWLDVGYSLYINGTIDDVRYYNYAMNQGEIIMLADPVDPGTEMYQPVPSLANIADPEPPLSRKVNFVDYAILADSWLIEQLWP